MKTWRRVQLSLVREQAPEPYDKQLKRPQDAVLVLRSFLGDDPREVFVAMYLDSQHRIIALHRVSVGTATQSHVHPREIFGPAMQLAATALVVAHNHPSGDPKPSPQDHLVTTRLQEAGELLGIELLDHLVICPESCYSASHGGVLS